MGVALPPIRPRRAVDLSPQALLRAGVSGVLAADIGAAESGRWSLATRAEDLAPGANRIERVGRKGVVAVVAVMGPIDQRATWQPCEGMTDGYDTIEARFRAAVDLVAEAGPGRGRVVQVIDSPGGDAAGMAPAVRRMRAYAQRAGVKVESVADFRATSAAFALTLIGDKTHVPRGGRTASIGTVIVRKPIEGAEGVEIFRSGDRKMRPNSVEPLNKEDRDDLQQIVDDSAADFAALVAEVRGKTAEHWLSLKGASLSGEAAMKAGLVDSTNNAHEVIEMALSDAARADMAEALGLPASASEAEIRQKASELRGVEGRLSALEGALATAKAEQAREAAARMALEEQTAREKAASEAQAKRAAFAAEVKAACDAGLITPPREAALLAHYEAHGEASARGALTMIKADAPIVKREKAGAAPGSSAASAALTDAQKEHAKAIGVTETEYAATVLGPVKEGA